jgi:hypothetical protein
MKLYVDNIGSYLHQNLIKHNDPKIFEDICKGIFNM